MKTPNLKQKIAQYEAFLHKINMCCISFNRIGIEELVKNADDWSYSHRIGNGELSDRKQQEAINNAFWKLCDTPNADKLTKERQQKYSEAKIKNNYES